MKKNITTFDSLQFSILTKKELLNVSGGKAPSWFWMIQPAWDFLCGMVDAAKNDPKF